MRIQTKIVLLLLLSSWFGRIYCQNYIGMKQDDIIETMKNSQTNFKLNKNVVNPHYNYLKFEDSINEMTLLFFLSEEGVCTMTRQMCDYSNINDVEEKLNTHYKNEGKNLWSYSENGKKYNISLVEEDWFFTVTTKEED